VDTTTREIRRTAPFGVLAEVLLILKISNISMLVRLYVLLPRAQLFFIIALHGYVGHAFLQVGMF